MEKQSRAGDITKHPCPQCEHTGVQLAIRILASERDVMVAESRQCVHFEGRIERGIAPQRLGQMQTGLGVDVETTVTGIEDTVRDAVVDRVETGGSDIAQPADLYGRRSAGEDSEAPAAAVQREVNENVYAIVTYELCC